MCSIESFLTNLCIWCREGFSPETFEPVYQMSQGHTLQDSDIQCCTACVNNKVT